MFTAPTAPTTFSGSPQEDYAQVEKLINFALMANSINLEPKTESTEDLIQANEAKAALIIFSYIHGPARSHIADCQNATEMLAKLKEVYLKSNPLAQKLLRDSFLNTNIDDRDANAFYTELVRLQTQINATAHEKFKISKEDVKFQFVVGLLSHTTLSVMASSWMIDIQKNALSLEIPDMIQSVEMHRLQEEVLMTKRALNKMPKDFEDKEKPTRQLKKRPCKFCGEDHWDRECKEAPPCYKKPFHKVRECPDCQAAYATNKGR